MTTMSGQTLIDLKNKISTSFNQSHWLELGALADQLDTVSSHYRLLRSLSFGDNDYEGCVLEVLKQITTNNPKSIEDVTSYINGVYSKFLKDHPDKVIGENVASVASASRTIIFQPNVFVVPDDDVNKKLVSVMMPFEKSFDPVCDSIKAAAKNASMDCERADDIWESSVVIQDVFTLIFRSFIVICDFSNKNPNVFYEAGIAHTLGKHVIPIAQHETDIPFDLRHHRYIKYHNNDEGRAKLSTELTKRLNTLKQ